MNIADSVPTFKSVWDAIRGLNWIEQGLLGTAVSIAALAAGWKPVLSFYRWCVERYDGKILNLLRESLRQAQLKHSGEHIVLLPAPLTMIAQGAERKEASTYKTLRRLESRGKVKEVKEGWVLT